MGNFDRGSRGGGGRGFGRPGGSRSGGGRSFGGSRDFGNRGDREMFPAVCSDCGKDCEVPFRPTGSKPVLCSDCFGKSNGDRRPRHPDSGGRPQNNEQLNVISAKLDQVLALLNGAPKGKPARPVGGAPKAVKAPKPEKVITPKLDVSDIIDTPTAEVDAPVEASPEESKSE